MRLVRCLTLVTSQVERKDVVKTWFPVSFPHLAAGIHSRFCRRKDPSDNPPMGETLGAGHYHIHVLVAGMSM